MVSRPNICVKRSCMWESLIVAGFPKIAKSDGEIAVKLSTEGLFYAQILLLILTSNDWLSMINFLSAQLSTQFCYVPDSRAASH